MLGLWPIGYMGESFSRTYGALLYSLYSRRWHQIANLLKVRPWLKVRENKGGRLSKSEVWAADDVLVSWEKA